MKMKIKLLIIVGIMISFKLHAQNCKNSFSGVVIDFHDGSKLEGAVIDVLGSNKTASTDNQGRFMITGLCDQRYGIEVNHPNCATIFLELTMEGDKIMEIKMEHHLQELDEVKVVGTSIKKTNTAQEQTLGTETIEKYSGAALGDALKEINGVSTFNTGSHIVKPTIHGLTGSRVLVLNDGVRMQDMEWGEEHAPNVDINSASSISVIKGASALQYAGDAIGGIILMDQERLFPKDTLYGKTLMNGFSNGRGGNISSHLTKSFKKGWFLKGQASYKKLGDQEAPDYMLSNTGISEIGASVNFGKRKFEWGLDIYYSYYNAEIAILRASHIGNVDNLIWAINSGEPNFIQPFSYSINNPRQEVTHHLAKTKWYKRFKSLGKWTVQYDFQNNRRFEYDTRRGDNRFKPSIDLELTTHTLSTDFKWDAHEKIQLHFGVMGRYQENFPNPDTGVRRLIPDYEKYDAGAFLIGEYRFTDELLLDLGLRYDFTRIDAFKFYRNSRWEERGYDRDFSDLIIEELDTQVLTNPVFDYNNISGTVGFAYNMDSQSSFRINYALSQRAPNPSELFSDGLHHSIARIEIGDIRFNSETSHKVSASLNKDYETWGYVIEPYANFVSDFILLEPTGVELSIRGSFSVWEYRQTNARLLGVDASVYKNWSDQWQSNHDFSLVKGNDTELDIPLINIPAANLRNSISFSEDRWNNFRIRLESNYVFRQNETPPNFDVFSAEQRQDVLLEINTAPDAYHLLGMNASMDFQLGKNTSFTTGLTVDNILNTDYRDYMNRLRYFANDLGRNIMLQLKLNY